MRKAILFVLLLLAVTGYAKRPGRVTYQGVLTGTAGGAVADGTYSLDLKIFNTPTGGSPLWNESQTVATVDGVFSVVIGEAIPIPDSAFSDTAAYLEITVETDPPLSPRTRLESVPYSVISNSVQGEGPIMLDAANDASGEQGSALFDVDPDASGRVKVQFHWDVTDPSSARSSTLDWDFYADSSTQTAGHYEPIRIQKRIDKSSPFIAETELLAVGLSNDTASWLRQLSADSGLIENITNKTATAQAFGKRQHKPFRIAKTWGTTDGSATAELGSSIHVDSGFNESRLYNTPSATVEAHENGHAFGNGHLDYLKKVGDPVSGANSEHHLWIEADSGIIEIQTAENSSGLATGKRQHKPFVITKELDVIGVSSASDLSEYLDTDSGFTEIINVQNSSGHTSGKRQHRPLTFTKEWGAAALTDSVRWNTILHADSGYADTIEMAKTNLISGISHGVSQTREHILLSRQVGVPGSADVMTLELLTNDSGATTTMSRDDGVETAAIEMAVTDTAEWLALTTTTTATKYSNITLKRGVTGSQVSVSHVGAGANDGVFISSSAAAGGAIGINTSSPILPFQLVGDGCYTGTFGACSDKRYKRDIRPLNNSITTIEKLQGVSYSWKREDFPEQKFPEGRQIGLIAQDVEKVLPEIVLTDANGYKSIDYAKLTPVLIEAIKAQQQQIDSQQKQIDLLQEMLEQFVKNSKESDSKKYGMR